MGDVNPDERSALQTTERSIVFQRMPSSGALAGPVVIKKATAPIPYKVTSDSDPNGHEGVYDAGIKLEGLVPGARLKLEIFGQTYDLVVKGDVQPDKKKLSWYRERLYMMGYVTGEEVEVPDDLDLPAPDADGSDKVFVEFRKKLSQEFLEGLVAFQIDHNLPIDENILGDSEAMKNTRSLLELNAGT